MPEGLNYAVVHKTRDKGKVTQIDLLSVYGTQESIELALTKTTTSRSINTSFIERYNGTDRNQKCTQNQEKAICFLKIGALII